MKKLIKVNQTSDIKEITDYITGALMDVLITSEMVDKEFESDLYIILEDIIEEITVIDLLNVLR